MKDIAPELLLKLQEEFKKKFNASKKIELLNKKLLKGNATHQESNQLAIELGTILSDVYKENIKSEILPEGRLFYNIAKRTVEPTIKQNYDLISNYSKDVQSALNKKAGLRIQGKPPDINQDRIEGIINRVSSEKFEEVKWILDEPIKNFSQSIVDDTVKTNADFQYKLGLKPKIVRRETGSCCDWCKEVVGVYEYPKVPKDVYRRHRYCRCTVDYHPGDGKVQNVHTKKWIDPEKDNKIEKRKKIGIQIKDINRKDDSKQYKEYIKILGKDNMPSSLNLFQNLKYDNTKGYERLLREKETISKIKEKTWSSDFKKKVIETYYDFRKEGYEFTVHGCERFIKHESQGKYTKEEVLNVLNKDFNFKQVNDNRPVKYHDNIQIVYLDNKVEVLNAIKRGGNFNIKEVFYEYNK